MSSVDVHIFHLRHRIYVRHGRLAYVVNIFNHLKLPVLSAAESRKLFSNANVWKQNHLKFMFHKIASVIFILCGCAHSVCCLSPCQNLRLHTNFLARWRRTERMKMYLRCVRVVSAPATQDIVRGLHLVFQSVIKNWDIVNLWWKLKCCVEMKRRQC